MSLEYRVGDVFDRLAEIPDGSIDLIVSSPPFLALRSYLPDDHPDKDKEIGQEPTPAEFIRTHLELAAEYARVLAPHGSLCYEIGDTYSGSGGAGGDYNDDGLRAGQAKFSGSAAKRRDENDRPARINRDADAWPLAKSMCIVPHMFTGSLVYGWNLLDPEAGPSPAGRWRARNVVCWARMNPSPGALGDKFRPATSYITVACKSDRRYFDLEAVRIPSSPKTNARTAKGVESRPNDTKVPPNGSNRDTLDIQHSQPDRPPYDWHADDHPEDGDWLWQLNTQPYSGAHFATFPMVLPKRMIEAMCPQRVCSTCGAPSERIVDVSHEANRNTNGPQSVERRHVSSPGFDVRADRIAATVGWTDCGHDSWRPGVVLDPFGGSGTTAEAAQAVGRSAILIDIDDRNAHLAVERVGMFLEVSA